MKKEQMPQPQATLYCSGLFDGLPLKVEPEKLPYRCLVEAVEPVFNQEMPLELVRQIHNQQLFGNIEPTDKLPVGCCIGYFDVVARDPKCVSVLKHEENLPIYRVENAHLFETPIPVLHGRTDVPLDKWMPSYVAHLAHPSLNGRTLSVPVNEEIFSLARDGFTFLMDFTPEVEAIILSDEEDDSDPISKLRLFCGNREKWFNVFVDFFVELDENDETVLYPSVVVTSCPQFRLSACIKCREQI